VVTKPIRPLHFLGLKIFIWPVSSSMNKAIVFYKKCVTINVIYGGCIVPVRCRISQNYPVNNSHRAHTKDKDFQPVTKYKKCYIIIKHNLNYY
jgi:hypothetical protein